MIPVVLADPHPAVRAALTALLMEDASLEVVPTADLAERAEGGRAAPGAAAGRGPAAVGGGPAGMRLPGPLPAGTQTIVLGLYDAPAYAVDARRAGAAAYVLKDRADRELRPQIDALLEGRGLVTALAALGLAAGGSAGGRRRRSGTRALISAPSPGRAHHRQCSARRARRARACRAGRSLSGQLWRRCRSRAHRRERRSRRRRRPRATLTSMRVALACLTALVSASCTTRYIGRLEVRFVSRLLRDRTRTRGRARARRAVPTGARRARRAPRGAGPVPSWSSAAGRRSVINDRSRSIASASCSTP